MKPRWRHKRGKFAEEFQGLKDDVGGSVAPAAFEVIEEPAVGQKRQALGCDRRATCVTKKPFETHAVTSRDTHIGMEAEARNGDAARVGRHGEILESRDESQARR